MHSNSLFLAFMFLHCLRAMPSSLLSSDSHPRLHETTMKTARQGSDPSQVTTSSGRYTGHTSSRRPDVTEFLGISYGQPPTGSLRFASPLPFLSNQSFNASVQPPDCPYVARDWGSVPGESYQSAPRIMAQESADGYNAMSEDCLKLNIWVPESSDGLKPVMVFLYGGGFDRGSINNPAYIGDYLASNEDVIVLTFNFRVNIFGFSNAPGADTNVALRDVRLAIEWVRTNIGAFGGDVYRITLFGQSQGAYLISYYAHAFQDDPIASSFIQQSGTAFSTVQQNMTTKLEVWNAAAAAIGCDSSSEVTTLACMRSQNISMVLAAWSAVQNNSATTLPFGPVIDQNLIFADYQQLTADGQYAKLPLLLGSNDNEAGFYVLRYAGLNQFTLTQQQQNEIGLGLYSCPTAQDAAAKSESLLQNNVSVHRYEYFGDWPNLRLYPGSGAYHTSETSMVFGTMQDLSGLPNTDLEEIVSRYLQHAWSTFARDPSDGLSDLGWPRYNRSERTLVRLGFENETTASFGLPSEYDAVCLTLQDLV